MADEHGGFPDSMFGLRDRDRLTGVETKLAYLEGRAIEDRDTLGEIRDLSRETANQVKAVVANFILVGEIEKRVASLEDWRTSHSTERGFARGVWKAVWGLLVAAAGGVTVFFLTLIHSGK